MAMDTTFSDDEKRFLLAEMIKVSQTNVDALVQFVKNHATGYKFWSIVVPQGRNLEQCVQAAEHMLEFEMPRSSLERASLSTTSASPTRKPTGHATAIPSSTSTSSGPDPGSIAAPMPPSQHHPSFSPVFPQARGPHVLIQPRLVSTSETQPPPQPVPAPEGPPPKKRRGRPPRKPIDYSLPLKAPKPVAPKLTPMYSHSGTRSNPPLLPYPTQPGNTTRRLPAIVPSGDSSLPATPTHPGRPASVGDQTTPELTGTVRSRKRSRALAAEDSGPETSDGNGYGDSGVSGHAHETNAEHQMTSRASMMDHDSSQRHGAAPTEQDATVPRYTPSDDRGLLIPSRGPTLAPLTGTAGEPSLQPSRSTKMERADQSASVIP